MDPLLAVIFTRAAERLIVVGAGILSIYIGYRLFALVPNRNDSEGKLTLPGGFSFFASRVGPGVFFALFGAGLIAYSATRPVSFKAPELTIAAAQPGGAEYVGFGTDGNEVGKRQALPQGSAPREEVISVLNAWFHDLPADIAPTLRIDRTIAVKESKLALMRETWDSVKWGSYASFHRWITVSAQSGPPPDENKEAAEVFDRGLK
jgi:hypothetical protein